MLERIRRDMKFLIRAEKTLRILMLTKRILCVAVAIFIAVEGIGFLKTKKLF